MDPNYFLSVQKAAVKSQKQLARARLGAVFCTTQSGIEDRGVALAAAMFDSGMFDFFYPCGRKKKRKREMTFPVLICMSPFTLFFFLVIQPRRPEPKETPPQTYGKVGKKST